MLLELAYTMRSLIFSRKLLNRTASDLLYLMIYKPLGKTPLGILGRIPLIIKLKNLEDNTYF